MVESLVNRISVTVEDIESFHSNGFIPLRGLLTQKAVDGLRTIAKTSQLNPPPSSFYTGFAKMGYNIENTTLHEIFSSQVLQEVLHQVTRKTLRFTQAMGFELDSHHTGFNWHVGIQPYHYINPRDFACSFWIPLDPINTKEQHGGMAYVPKSIYSAREYYSLIHQLVQQENLSEMITAEEFHASQYASKIESLVLEKNRIEDDFNVGDAFLFDKIVWHRSCALREGALSSRTAYVVRLVDIEARYSKTFLEGLARSRESFGKPLNTLFGYKFSHLKDGDPLFPILQ